MRISIAMATYNGAQYLHEQLQSILQQTLQPDELVVVDDGSTDSTVDIIEEFSRKAPFSVRLFVNEKTLGYAGNFNLALERTVGDLVFLCDQDDVWLPNKIEVMSEIVAANPNMELFIHDLRFCDAAMRPIGQTKIERLAGSFDLMASYVVGMATVVRRPFLELCLPIPVSLDISHDDWLHQCANLINRKYIHPHCLADYRRHEKNATGGGEINVAFVTSKTYFFRSRLSANTLRAVRLRRVSLEAARGWLSQKYDLLEQNAHVSGHDIERSLEKLGTEVARAKTREEILSLSRLKRILPVLRHLLRGGYSCASGLQSAAKDILIR